VSIDLLIDGKENALRTVVLAHGAGAPMVAPWMTDVAQSLAARELRVVRFEFPYMAQRRETGKRSGPDRLSVLLETWRTVIDQLGNPDQLVIGGKSMGGRIATMVADMEGVAGLLCFSYPFHPAGRPEKTRTDHLGVLLTPTLIMQGTRDPLGNTDDVAGYELSAAIKLHWLEDGDHDLKPRKVSGRSHAQNLAEAVDAAVAFVATL
jgi:predicted alpha/beta-hydrolase family hydrolase